MNTTHKPAAILFDFGGTLDADGVAWKDRFRRLWCEEVGEIASAQFDPVFYAVDDGLVGTIPPTTSFYDTVGKIACGVSHEMGRFDDVVGGRIAKRFVDESLERIRGNVLVLRDLSLRYRLGIVSNFYGNLSAICREVGLSPFLSTVIDCASRIRKSFTRPCGFFRSNRHKLCSWETPFSGTWPALGL
jgi:putative hydrolase of the HAD superfamily